MTTSAAPRTRDQLRDECLARVARNAYPLTGLHPPDVETSFKTIRSLDPDEWAGAWSAIAAQYEAAAESREREDPAAARGLLLQAWRTYSFARWPVPNSPGKKQAYKRALSCFRRSLAFCDPPVETIRIPFEEREIVGYLRLPKASPAPLVLAISGLDSRKEDLAERLSFLIDRGVGYFALDSQGTGEAPLPASASAHRVYIAALDYLAGHAGVDTARLGVYGASFGAHWATKLAFLAADRLKAVVAQSPPIHHAFAGDHVRKVASNTEYLFDYLPAAMSIFEGVGSLDQLVEARGVLSLVKQNCLAGASAPMLIVGGALDTQVPIEDLELVLQSGTSPKEAWINPVGGHMGRERTTWPDGKIFDAVIAPWLVRTLS